MSLFGIDAEAINPEVYDPHPPTAGFYQRITCQQEFCRIYKGSAALFINPKTNHPNAKEETNFFHLRPIFDVVVVPPL